MNKLGRLAAWGKEKMGTDSKNSLSEDYKALELEMQMRHEGMLDFSMVPRTVLSYYRHREDVWLHGHLRQVLDQADRRRWEREEHTYWLFRHYHVEAWRSIRGRKQVWGGSSR